MNKTTELFFTLVKIDSPSGEEKEISFWLEKWLNSHGYSWKKDAVGNLIASPKNITPKFFLCAHLDTVEPGRGIKPVVKGDYIQSDGNTILGADNKASLAAYLSAIEEYQAKYNSLPPVELLFTVREETGGGAEHLDPNLLKSKHGLIFDYSKPFGFLIKASPYIINFNIKLEGKSAHSSRPEEGINSLIPAAKIISAIPIGKLDQGKTTINIGLVKSGSGITTIPGQTEIQGEVRSLNKEFFANHSTFIESTSKEIAKEYGVRIIFSTDGYCGGYEFSDDDEYLNKIKKIYSTIGIETQLVMNTSVSDANSLNDIGLKTVNMSESVENPHTLSEKISIDNLVKLKDIVLTFLERMS